MKLFHCHWSSGHSRYIKAKDEKSAKKKAAKISDNRDNIAMGITNSILFWHEVKDSTVLFQHGMAPK